MEILLILSLSVMLSSLMYGSQRDTDKAPNTPKILTRVMSFGIAKIIVALILFVIVIGLPFK